MANRVARGSTAVGVAMFDVRKARELDDGSRLSRLVFAVMFAGISLLVLPWPPLAAWIVAVVVWETVNTPFLGWIVARPSPKEAISIYAASNFVGSAIFSTIALMGLATGSLIGVAIGATWLCGSFMSNFIYFGENQRILWASLVPGIAAAIVGPLLTHGFSVSGFVIGGLILTALLAARSFSIDHQVLLQRLADRQGALADVERKLSVAVEASGDGLFEVDLVAQTGEVSAGWRSMLGYGESDPLDADPTSYVHPDERAEMRSGFAAHFRGETIHTTSELRLRCNDGSYKWVLSRARLVSRTPEGLPLRLIGTTVDITARKALEHQLSAALQVAERANAAKGEFVANISHEIRTPLNGVLGMVQAMAFDDLSPSQRERLDVIRGSGEMLLAILNDVLDLSKIEAGKFQLEEGIFDIEELVRGAHSAFAATSQTAGLTFGYSVEPQAAGAYFGDTTRVRQILYNLLSNAVKFTPQGEVGLVIALAEIGFEVRVRDTGIGIAPHRSAQLFQKFEQGDASTTRRFGGTGLGLSICRELAELMGGCISVASVLGEGSTFTVRLPLQRSAVSPRAPSPERPTRPLHREQEAGALRILAAEDNAVNQLVLRTLLQQVGIEPTLVENGEAALEAWENDHWDIILMDVQMPVMDGPTAARRIREREAATGRIRTPIVALTANALSHQVTEYLQSGMDRFVAKPIEVSQLFAAIDAALGDVTEIAEPPRAARA